MLGPANPNAAIASMFGAPKGFPPIWSITHKHVCYTDMSSYIISANEAHAI